MLVFIAVEYPDMGTFMNDDVHIEMMESDLFAPFRPLGLQMADSHLLLIYKFPKYLSNFFEKFMEFIGVYLSCELI